MNKLVVITGASSGFGMSLAQQLSDAGYSLLLLARRLEKMEAMNLPNTMCRKVDVSDREAFENAVREAEYIYGKTDLIVNNAGVMLLGNMEDQNPSEWNNMLDVNLKGVMNGMQIVMKDMKERRSGTIINISSTAGIRPYGNHAAYCATKYGVVGMTEVVREELSPFNVRVLYVCPGAVKTELLDHTTRQDIKDGYVNWRDSNDVNTISSDDVAKTIKFAYEMPQGVSLREIVITDTRQDQ